MKHMSVTFAVRADESASPAELEAIEQRLIEEAKLWADDTQWHGWTSVGEPHAQQMMVPFFAETGETILRGLEMAPETRIHFATQVEVVLQVEQP